MNFVVHLESLAHDVRIGTELIFPIFVAQHQNRRRAELVVIRQKSPPHQRIHSKKVEVIRRHDRCSHPIRIPVPVENERHRMVFHQPCQRLVLLAIILDFVHRKSRIVDALLLCLLANEDELLALRIWKRSQKHSVYHAEYRGIRSDPERKRKHGKTRESDILAHRPQSVSGVLLKHFPVLARRRRENARQRFPPHANHSHRSSPVPRLTLLIVEGVLHLAAIVRTEVRRQDAQQRPKHSFRKRKMGRVHRSTPPPTKVVCASCPYASSGLRNRFLLRAIATSSSKRRASFIATRRPRSVSR